MLSESWWAAIGALFLFGLVGSLHCAGMCSPLSCATCGASKKRLSLLVCMRLASYFLAGLIVGAFGQALFRSANGVPGAVFLAAMAFVTLLAIFWPRLRKSRSSALRAPNPLLTRLRLEWRRLQGTSVGSLVVGLAMPLLPCGFLWLAFAEAALLGDSLGSGLGMAAFALGTTPALFGGHIALAGVVRRIPIGPQVRRVVAVLLAVGLWGWTYHSLQSGGLPCH